jgi:cyclophilin family peptidyl-prolyl cis-trans isomerase
MTRRYDSPPPMTIEPAKSYTATLATNRGDIEIALDAMTAPITVNSFVFLARDGFYDGLSFHRVIPNFMIQGGCPDGTGRGDPGYRFRDEFDGGRSFDQPYLLAMANAGPGTNGSQFFITVAPTPHLTNRHTIFGTVVSGQDVVDEIAVTKTSAGDRPVEPVIIDKVTITEA